MKPPEGWLLFFAETVLSGGVISAATIAGIMAGFGIPMSEWWTVIFG